MRESDFLQPRRELPRKAYLLAAALPFLFLFIVWSILSYSGFIAGLFLPTPTKVVQAAWGLVESHGLFQHALVSTYRILLGFLVAAVFAIPLGILMGTFRVAEAFFEPLNDFIRYMPVAAFIPLTILWVGIGDLEKIAIIFIGTFFQLVLMVADNTKAVPTEYLEVVYTLGASKWGAIRKVLIPAALPTIFDSMRIAMGWAWSYLVVAEIVAANRGLGFLIIQAQRFLKTDEIFAGIIIIGIIGLATDYAFRWAARRLFPWTVNETNA